MEFYANLKSTTLSNIGKRIFGQFLTKSNGNKLPTEAKTRELLDLIMNKSTYRSKQDIDSWIEARAQVESVTMLPVQYKLQTMYEDVVLDDHLTGVMSQRIDGLLANDFRWYDAKTKKENTDLTDLFEKPWFYDLLKAAIESKFYGHSLVQLIPFTTGGVSRIELIPRKYVIPKTGELLVNYASKQTIPYRGQNIKEKLVEIGNTDDLGMLYKAAKNMLYKKNVVACWSDFCEVFGEPIRVGKVASTNQKDLDKMEGFLQDMGRSAYAVIGPNDEIELKETTRGDAWQVFFQFIDMMDKGNSKIVLTQTMTTDNGSSLSQAQVHMEMMKSIVMKSDMRFIKFFVNETLAPVLQSIGYDLTGSTFGFNVPKAITDTELQADQMLLNNFEFDNFNWISEKYNVPIKGLKPKQTLSGKVAKQKPSLKGMAKLGAKIDSIYKHDHPHD